MKLFRITNLRLGLILALLLPLQVFAALPNCALPGTHQDWHMTQSFAADHCDHAHPGAAHHDCGSCCSVAAVGKRLELFQANRFTPPQPALKPSGSPVRVALDRLDRPPRINFT